MRLALACLALIFACVLVYAPVSHFGFMATWDDAQYITENVHVSHGLTAQGAAWAFTSMHAANWHPLTWLSHMLDVELFGMDPGPHHVVNLVFHVLNTLLLFGFLYSITGALGRSAFVAALFAVHPLHVESVAWISERKDVLSTFFWLASMWAYVSYTRRPRLNNYLIVMLFLCLGLLAKPMLVTLPFALLLLDFWPLQRVQFAGGGNIWRLRRDLLRLVAEKIPLIVLAVASCVVTFWAQQRGGAVAPIERLAIGPRLGNAVESYLAYIGKMVWPFRLSAFYPARHVLSVLSVAIGVAFLIGVTVLAMRAGQRFGFFLVGWLWYVGTLVPVIGLVQVGDQAMADRYTYVPLIGLFVIVAWAMPALLARWRWSSTALPVAAVALLALLTTLAKAQVSYWSDDMTLWQHALETTEDNHVAHNSLGGILSKQGRVAEAMPHLEEALRLRPNFTEALNNMGMALMWQEKLDQAVGYFREALRLQPDYILAQNNIGAALTFQGKFDEAVPHLAEALRLKPDFADAHRNMGRVLSARGDLDVAIREYTEALRLSPDFADAHDDLGVALARRGRIDEAIQHFSEALRIQPGFEEARRNLNYALSLRAGGGR